MKNKNIILGSVVGLSFENIRPFIYSLKKLESDKDLCLFISNVNKTTLDSLSENGIKLLPFDLGNIHLQCYRYLLYQKYLSNNKYSNVMLTDVRDVTFQRNPFDFEFDNLSCFLEDKRKTINSCNFNSNWIRQAYGSDTLSEIGSNSISCSGTTIGPYSSIVHYLDNMAYQIKGLGPKANIIGIDQGIHNYLIYENLIDCKLFENYYGAVLTMGYSHTKDIHFNNEGFIINNDNSIINVLHQYDRHREIAYRIHNKLSLLILNSLKNKIEML